MKELSLGNVRINGGFWHTRQELNRASTLPAVYGRFYETGRITAFDFSLPWEEGKQPHFFWDSDVAKWIEGVAYEDLREPTPTLMEQAERIIDNLLENQGEDGYFNIYFQRVEPENRFSNRDKHELYCAGHLMEAAVAWYEATGDARFLSAMERYADYIDRVFRVERSAAFSTPGHEEIELALVRLYCATGKEKYLTLASFFVDERGQNENDISGNGSALPPAYFQSHQPVREQKSAVGHAVRALYLYAGMADLARLRGDETLLHACRTLFHDVADKKMYVTGGVGSTAVGEAFTIPFDLPSETAYTETCAAIALVFFAQRMLLLDPENGAKYADVLERALYNGVLSGVSLAGDTFFYENPLSIHLANRIRHTGTGKGERLPRTQRPAVFGCSCCPPNICRLISSVGRYLFTEGEGGEVSLWQFASSEAKLSCGGRIRVETDYPRSGEIRISAEGVSRLRVRVPGWCESFRCDADFRDNGDGTITVEAPSALTLALDMPVVAVEAHPDVWENTGRAAVMRGPIVYCAEGCDNESFYSLCLSASLDARLLDADEFGVPMLEVNGYARKGATSLYAPYGRAPYLPVRIRMIPYFGMENRGETDMAVWLPIR